MTLKNDFSHQFGLEHIAAELGVDFTPHRAVDDAYATMRVVEAMCATKDCHYPELASILGFSNGKIENYSITRPQSKGFKKYNTDVRAAKEQRSKCRIKFYNNLSRKRVRKGALNGKVFNFFKGNRGRYRYLDTPCRRNLRARRQVYTKSGGVSGFRQARR